MNRADRLSSLLVALSPAILILALFPAFAIPQTTADTAAALVGPPQNVRVSDTKGDEGGSITVTWDLSPDDHGGADTATAIIGYEILRSESAAGPFQSVGFAPKGATRFADASTHDGVGYYYQVVASTAQGGAAAAPVGPVMSSAQWFNTNRTNVLVIGLLLSGSIIYYIASARRGKKLFIRRIAGLEAVQEAIGRATEMGRPILYIPGIQDMDDVQTVAGVTILGYVARTIAEYDTKIEVPTSRSIVMSTARETIKSAYIAAGRPDAYSDDAVHYVTDEQFGYVAAVDGIMVRDKPATCFYMGAFFAESLIMAETGNSIGAIQIAGTAMPAQLPFFVAACDYTLIGEELFAASAYLSNEPKQLGSLKGQDVGKSIAMLAIASGVILLTLHQVTRVEWFLRAGNWVKDLFLLN
ncbi:MAG TPA: fibronectin type III domain-containing protein [bacterium]|nr:fibronectin type III domain-containing protein [bacterium]